jgi:hypothetical protein
MEEKLGELYSFGHNEPTIGVGLLGAVGRTYHEACENRLREIERRILAIEAMLSDPPRTGSSVGG